MSPLDTVPDVAAAPRPAPVRDRARYLLGMLPAAVAGLTGSPSSVARHRRRVAALGDPAHRVGGRAVPRARAVAHAVLGIALGALAWFVAALTLAGFARGPLYGLVVDGPYDGWGGPSLAGAWAVHAAVWAATLPVAAALAWGLVALHARLTARLLGADRSRWVLPATVLVAVAGVVFLIAWSHQL